MKKIFNWTVTMSFILVAASALTYTIHYLIFRDVHHIFIYMIGDLAFLFLDVLLVILLIERLLSRREKKALMKKLNMVIGTFFSEVGLELLEKFSSFVENSHILEKKMDIKAEWNKKDFQNAMSAAKNFSYDIQIDKNKLSELRDFLVQKEPFMIRLLENPNLLEHDQFTDLLWAVFHLTEELKFRGDKLKDLPSTDYDHIAGDMKRAYSRLTVEWLSYTSHLQSSYPFLFSLLARINPMNPQASPVVR